MEDETFYGLNTKALGKFMSSNSPHRTHQQAFMREAVMPFLVAKAVAFEKGHYDLCNEATCRLCAALLANLPASENIGLPYI